MKVPSAAELAHLYTVPAMSLYQSHATPSRTLYHVDPSSMVVDVIVGVAVTVTTPFGMTTAVDPDPRYAM